MARKAVNWFGLVVVGAAAFVCVRRWRRRRADAAERSDPIGPAVERPPLASVPDLPPDPGSVPGPDPSAMRPDPAPVEPEAPAPEPPATAAEGGPRWLAPIGEDCPPGHPIKVNERSGIYHVPGGRSYDRTRPTRCYPNEAAAEADGFRRAKR